VRERCPRGHPFTPENTYEYRGARLCRTCRRAVMLRMAVERRLGRPDQELRLAFRSVARRLFA